MKEIFIEKREHIRRIAIKKSEILIECFIEEEKKEAIPGQIYKGIIKNIVPGIKSAFVDIGYEKNAYLHLTNENFKKGQEVLVEVIKEELNDKKAKVVNNITLPGRYVVLTNGKKGINFSKKITNEEFKNNCSENLVIPEKLGIMIRTKGEKVSIDSIQKEIDYIKNKYEKIQRDFLYSLKPGLLYKEKTILDKILRDIVEEEDTKIIVDSKDDYKIIYDYINDKEDIRINVSLYEGHRNLFDFYGIEKEILVLRHNKVNLECGGYIVIDKTEAMYVIDVNSGKNVIGKSIDKTAFITNNQAAKEISRQIRLRNLSGIILIDFIDMESKENKRKILKLLKDGFVEDKNDTVVYPHTELDLVQITRRRKGKTISEYMEEPCKNCNGEGKRLKASYITLLIKNDILKKNGENSLKDIYIEINNIYEKIIRDDLFNFIKEINGFDKNIYLNFTECVEYFKVEPLIFLKQIENLSKYKIQFDEK